MLSISDAEPFPVRGIEFSWPQAERTPEEEFKWRHIPEEKFVEYEPKDLEWMIPLGMAPPLEFRMLAPRARITEVMLRNHNYDFTQNDARRLIAAVYGRIEAEVINSPEVLTARLFGDADLWIPGQV